MTLKATTFRIDEPGVFLDSPSAQPDRHYLVVLHYHELLAQAFGLEGPPGAGAGLDNGRLRRG